MNITHKNSLQISSLLKRKLIVVIICILFLIITFFMIYSFVIPNDTIEKSILYGTVFINGEKASEGVKTALKVALGVVFLALGIGAVIYFRGSVWILIKGCVGPFLLLAGAITIAIAKE